MIYFNKSNNSFQYKTDWSSDIVKVHENQELIDNMEYEEIRNKVKKYIDRFTESEYSKKKLYIE